MPRNRRQIIADSCYELCFRAKDSLPLSCQRIIRELLGSTLARTQRDNKLTLCHDLWNGSHPHMLVVTNKGAEQVAKFYMEVKKKITESLKRLLGIEHLNLWEEGGSTVIRVLDLEKAKEKIAYLYSNPAQDDLEESVERFPGYSSWKEFMGSSGLEAKST